MRQSPPRCDNPATINPALPPTSKKETSMSIVQLVQTAEVKFNFRENKETKVKRAAVELKVPEITVAALAQYLSSEDGKVVSLVTENIQSVLNSYIRSFVDADTDFDQAKLDALVAEGKISIEAIANLPRSERNTLTNADLEEFGKFYFKAAQELLGKTESQATAAVVVFNSRIKKIAGNPVALDKVAGDLDKLLDVADEAVLGEHEKALSYLIAKIAEYKAEDITEDSL